MYREGCFLISVRPPKWDTVALALMQLVIAEVFRGDILEGGWNKVAMYLGSERRRAINKRRGSYATLVASQSRVRKWDVGGARIGSVGTDEGLRKVAAPCSPREACGIKDIHLRGTSEAHAGDN